MPGHQPDGELMRSAVCAEFIRRLYLTPTEIIGLLLSLLIGYVTLRNSRALLALSEAKTSEIVVTAPIKAEERADDILKTVVSGWSRALENIAALTAEMHDSNELERKRQEQIDKDGKNTSSALNTLRTEMPGAVRIEMKQDFDAVQKLVDEFRKEMGDKLDQVSIALKSLADRAPQSPPAAPTIINTINPAPATPQPTSVPEMTKQVTVVETDPSPTAPMPGGQTLTEVTP